MSDRTNLDQRNVPEPETNLGETIERAVGVIKRRRWWILSAACCIPVAVILFELKLPNQYVSQATLLVVQQQVSQRYVAPDSNTSIAAAIQGMKLEVLSRNRLLEIINDLGLYGTDNPVAPPELRVERMRQEIEIQPVESVPGTEFNAFTVSFAAANPRLAQEVTGRLASLFIEQNLKNRGEQATSTTKFLSSQLDAAKMRLAEQEQRLQSFKSSNLGELPEQQQANIMALADVRARLDAVISSLAQAQQQQSSLEVSLGDRLARLQGEKTALLSHYTSRHPEVLAKDTEIARAQAVLDRLKGSSSPLGWGDNSIEDPSLQTILRQAESISLQIAALTKQQEKLKAESEQYQKRLNLTPVREQQLADIQRDYNLYKQDYTDLLNKKLQSQMTTSLEENQEGQQFRLVDPPSLPAKPTSPKRLKASLGGLAGGILIGLILAFVLDLRDSSYHSENALSESVSLPFVIAIPLVRTPQETRAHLWKVTFELVLGCLMLAATFAAEFYVFKNG